MNPGAWKWVRLLCRMILGGLFVYASLHKIAHPADFARILYQYDILPGWSIHILAVWLPWLELLAGSLLVAGVFPRGAALVLAGLLLVFIAALSINAIRGYRFDCGCFVSSGGGGEKEGPIPLIIRDLVLLVPAAILLWSPSRASKRTRP